jgi:hypothetical protein
VVKIILHDDSNEERQPILAPKYEQTELLSEQGERITISSPYAFQIVFNFYAGPNHALTDIRVLYSNHSPEEDEEEEKNGDDEGILTNRYRPQSQYRPHKYSRGLQKGCDGDFDACERRLKNGQAKALKSPQPAFKAQRRIKHLSWNDPVDALKNLGIAAGVVFLGYTAATMGLS